MPAPITRRELLKGTATGFGMLALSALLADEAYAGLRPHPGPHFKPRAKRIIFCFMDGGVSHVDSFDPKPKLAELNGKAVGKVENVTAGGDRKWLKCPWTFQKVGKSGMDI